MSSTSSSYMSHQQVVKRCHELVLNCHSSIYILMKLQWYGTVLMQCDRGESRGVHRELVYPLSKIVQEDRDTPIEQSI